MFRSLLIALAFASTFASSPVRAQAPADADQLRLDFEREKWRDELNLRTRELSLRERELTSKETELQSKQRAAPPASPWYTNPLVLAILAAAIAAIGNAVVATVNGMMQRRLETAKREAELALEGTKAESTRILEMIKTGDTEAAAKNLQFLVDTGLVANPERAGKLRDYLANRTPGSGPALPAASSRFGFEKTESLTTTLEESVRRNLEGFVSYLDQVGFPKDAERASIKIYKMNPPNAFYRDGTLEIDVGFAEDPYTALREFGHHALTAPMADKWWARSAHVMPIESGLADYFAASFLNNPRVGEVIARLERMQTPYLRTLDNDWKFAEFAKLPDTTHYHKGGEIWGGAFWEMRSRLGRERFDPILAKAWLAAVTLEEEPTRKSFIGALLTAAEDNASADAIRSVLRRRGYPLPRAPRQT